jgi:hypothetical protein
MKTGKAAVENDRKALTGVPLALDELNSRVNDLIATADHLIDRLACVTKNADPEKDVGAEGDGAANCAIAESVRVESARVLGVTRLLEKQIDALEV